LSSRFDGIGGLPRGDKGRIETSLVPPWNGNMEEIILNNKITKTNVIIEIISIALPTLSRQLQRFAHAP